MKTILLSLSGALVGTLSAGTSAYSDCAPANALATYPPQTFVGHGSNNEFLTLSASEVQDLATADVLNQLEANWVSLAASCSALNGYLNFSDVTGEYISSNCEYSADLWVLTCEHTRREMPAGPIDRQCCPYNK